MVKDVIVIYRVNETISISIKFDILKNRYLTKVVLIFKEALQGVLEIRRIFSLVDMITNTNFSNCPFFKKIKWCSLAVKYA